jgi:hypothetical protein
MTALRKSSPPMIKVNSSTHEKLRDLAELQQRSMGEIITELVDRYEEDLFWAEAKQQLDRLKSDPVAWKDYLDEMAEWDAMPNDILDLESPYESTTDDDNVPDT